MGGGRYTKPAGSATAEHEVAQPPRAVPLEGAGQVTRLLSPARSGPEVLVRTDLATGGASTAGRPVGADTWGRRVRAGSSAGAVPSPAFPAENPVPRGVGAAPGDTLDQHRWLRRPVGRNLGATAPVPAANSSVRHGAGASAAPGAPR